VGRGQARCRGDTDFMSDSRKILLWLPSPLGDAILATPALRAIRERFDDSRIHFYASGTVRAAMEPCDLCDEWIEAEKSKNPFATAKELKKYGFDAAILFKNSLGSAAAVFIARIPVRVGYSREWRGVMLTDKLRPHRLAGGGYKPVSMVDYYLALAEKVGADISERSLVLRVSPDDVRKVTRMFPEMCSSRFPIVVLVPGGAFGPSKCWAAERYAALADWLVEKYEAIVVVSVAPTDQEKAIAKKICDASHFKLINLAERPLSLGELKGLLGLADVVVCNDTGPRHMAIAIKKSVVTLFGPNDPAWTETGFEGEVKIVSDAACAPCQRPECTQTEHICMKAISVETVKDAVAKILARRRKLE
jgi:heptosyltransferase II